MHEAGFAIVTGDRHWQYHSLHPSGIHEFGSGTLVRQNARIGRKPGDPDSTDPEALIQQPFTNAKPTGGFLLVRTQTASATSPATLEFLFIDDEGTELYRYSMQR